MSDEPRELSEDEKALVRFVVDEMDASANSLLGKLRARWPDNSHEACQAGASHSVTQAITLLQLVGGERLARAVLASRIPGGAAFDAWSTRQ